MIAWLERADREHLPLAPGCWSGMRSAARSPPASRPHHGDRLGRLVLVDALGLAAFAPAPEFGAAAGSGSWPQPSEDTHELLWRHCALDLDAVRAADGRALGGRSRPTTSTVRGRRARMAALGSLMGDFGLPAIPAAELARIAVPTTPDLGPPRPGHAAGRRRGRERPPRLAAARDRGLRRRSADRAAGGVPARAAARARRCRRARGRGLRRRDRRPRPPPLRRAAPRLQRDGRPPPGADRPLRRCAATWRRRSASRASTGCRVSVYGGGHNVTGNAVCDDGVTIDLRPMKGDRGRSRDAHLPRRGRAHLGRARRRHPGARPRRDRRADVDHGHRRARARRRLGLDRAQAAATGSTT